MMETRIECDNKVNGFTCGKLLFKLSNGNLQIKCRNSKCKAVKNLDLNKLLELSKKEASNA